MTSETCRKNFNAKGKTKKENLIWSKCAAEMMETGSDDRIISK